MCRLLQCNKPYNDCCLQTEYPWRPHPKHSGVAGWTCGSSKGTPPEDLFSNRIEGKKFLGWILTLIHAEKMGNFYWLPLLKKLPSSMVEGFQEVKEILAEKGLTRCPPIARSDLEDGTSANSSSSTITSRSASTSSGNGGEVVVWPPKSGIRTGSGGDGPGPEGFVNPSDAGGQQCLHHF